MLNYVSFKITEEDEALGRDIRWFLRARLGFSRTKIRSLKFDPRGILLDREPVPNWTRVRAGQVLQVLLTDSEAREKHIIPNELPLEILYEDANLLILNKPAGVVCHPAKGHLIDTLSNGVQYYFESQCDFDSRIHLVGRLDKDVSGIVTIAKNAVVSERLQEDRAAGRLEKHYTALVRGTVPEEVFELRTTMREAVSEDDFRRAVPAEEGKACVTRCRVLELSGGFTLLDVCPDTGRLHQIRFSLAEAGFPILGDTLYGGDPQDSAIGRVMLHARTLRYTEPFSGEIREIKADLPKTFRSYI